MVGRHLRDARRAAGLSQEAVSTRARVDRSYLSQLERDLKSPTVEMLQRICRALGVRASDLLARAEKTQSGAPTRPLQRKTHRNQ
jgi:transcriptional regulator with XRE-family HTH domain